MPRRPLLPFVTRNPGGRFEVGTHAFGQRPELETVIAACLMSWPPAEAEMALVLAQLLGASESEAVLAVFHSLRRSSAQRDAISEAARVTLGDDDQKLLTAIMAVHKATETHRNDLTHGHFGIYTNLIDGIVWMGTKAYVDFKARMELANQTMTSEIRDALYSGMSFYKKPDLDRILKDIKDIADIWHAFTRYLRSRPPQRAELYRQLCARPRIRQELDRLGRETDPQAQPR